MRGERLPPGQREVKGVPLRQIGAIPKSDLNTWRLEVYGEVEKPMAFSFEDLRENQVLSAYPIFIVLKDGAS